MSDKKAATSEALALERVEPLIHEIRGEKVIFDSDLARLYGVTTKRLNEQVKRNQERFPDDFMFQLSAKESPLQGRNLRPVHRKQLILRVKKNIKQNQFFPPF